MKERTGKSPNEKTDLMAILAGLDRLGREIELMRDLVTERLTERREVPEEVEIGGLRMRVGGRK